MRKNNLERNNFPACTTFYCGLNITRVSLQFRPLFHLLNEKVVYSVDRIGGGIDALPHSICNGCSEMNSSLTSCEPGFTRRATFSSLALLWVTIVLSLFLTFLHKIFASSTSYASKLWIHIGKIYRSIKWLCLVKYSKADTFNWTTFQNARF